MVQLEDAVDRHEKDLVLSMGEVVGQVMGLTSCDMARQGRGLWSRMSVDQWVQMFGEKSTQMVQ